MNELVNRRRGLFGRDLLVRVGLIWLVVATLLLVTKWSAIASQTFADPDDIMRLMQVRDLYAGQGWFDITQYRVDAAAGGVPMHWSRLVDIPILAVIALLTPLFGQSGAEMAALIIVPLFTLFLALLLAGRVAWRLAGVEAAGFTCLVMALSVPLLFQLSPMRIDHHGWQIVCALLAINGLMARAPRPGAIVMGVALSLWLSISVEALPLTAAFCAALAFRCLKERAAFDRFAALMVSLFITSLVLFLFTRGLADLAQYCDAMSPVHVGIFGWGAAGSVVLANCRPHAGAARLLCLAGLAAGAVAIALLAAPQCASGGFADLDPVVASVWHSGVAEGLPFWRQDATSIVQIVVPSLLGIYAAWELRRRCSGWLKDFWGDFILILWVALILALLLARAAAVANALAAIPLGWLIAQWLKSARTLKNPAKRIMLLTGIVLALMPTIPLTLYALIPSSGSDPSPTLSIAASGPRAASCEIADAEQTLAALTQGEIVAPLDISPGLLLASEHSVVATAHHRGDQGMRFVIDTFTAPPEQARRMIAARGSAYLALCPDLAEAQIYARTGPDGLMAAIIAEDTPDWLEPIALSEDTGLKLWRIRR